MTLAYEGMLKAFACSCCRLHIEQGERGLDFIAIVYCFDAMDLCNVVSNDM